MTIFTGILTGYGVHINQLHDSDVAEHKIDLKGWKADDCIAVHGEDLDRCLTMVVGIPPNHSGPILLWSDIDGHGTEVPRSERGAVADAVARVAQVVHPDLPILVD